MIRNCARAAGLMLVVASWFGLVASAQAAESINSYQVSATIRPDTLVDITETIAYDFSDAQDRHGIYRDLVLSNEDTSGRTRQYDVKIAEVTVDGSPAEYTTSEADGQLRVRIGDADTTIAGRHTYVIHYTVAHALRVITKADLADPQMPPGLAAGDVEFYWNLIENNFEVPIATARAVVGGPAAPLAARCLLGSLGSTQDCPLSASGTQVRLGPAPVSSGEFLTTAIDYPAQAFPVAPVEVFEAEQPIALGLILGAGAFLGLVLVPVALAIRWRRRDRGVSIGATPVQFEAPDRLTAVEMAAAWKGDSAAMRARALVAAITDLAARGHLTIADADDLTVTLLPHAAGRLADWESRLLQALLARGTSVTLSAYDPGLAQAWAQEFEQLVGAAEVAGRRNAQGDAPDRRWNWLFLITIVGVAGFIWSIVVNSQPGGIVAVALTLGSLIGGLIARAITPRRETEESARFLGLTLGFRRLLETDASVARREFAQRLGLPAQAILATMLPYAIIFSLEESWVGAFPDLTPEELRSTGFNVLTAAALASAVNAASHSASSALTAPSSGAGSSGGAGGGGGGGGGGSW